MFTNIGKKIKTWASVLCWLGIVCSVILGIAQCVVSKDMIVTGILTIIGGALASWIGSFMVYGFGELVDNSQAIRAKLENK